MASFTNSSNGIFQFESKREMVELTKAVELLGTIDSNLDPHHVNLSNKSFSSEAAELIANKLKTYQNIKIANIADIIAGRPEEDALKSLKYISDSFNGSELIEVDVSDNALGSKGVYSCRNVLSGKKLEKLYVCNNGLAAETAVLISEILLENGCPDLKLLHFYNNMSGDDGAIAVGGIIKCLPSLNNLRFSGTRSQKKGCFAIADAICSITTLKYLDIADNMFKGEAGLRLAVGLQQQDDLTYLNLRDGGLGEKGSLAVINAIINSKFACNLKFLDLSGNDINTDVASNLSELFSVLSSLEEFAIDDNEVGTEGIIEISKGIRKCSHLKSFSACTNEISACGAVSLARCLSKLDNFTTLKIDGNAICGKGVEMIEEIFEETGKILVELEDNDDEGDDDLEDLEEEEEVEEQDEQKQEENEDDADELTTALGNVKIEN